MKKLRHEVSLALLKFWGHHARGHCLDGDPLEYPYTAAAKAGCWYERALWGVIHRVSPHI